MVNSKEHLMRMVKTCKDKVKEMKEVCKKFDTDYNRRLLTYWETRMVGYQNELDRIEEREHEREMGYLDT
ncbi:hypothetical protein [Bacillus cereus]|uniref:hypothetical protein n=1 Tax=Bacillus cereus TaxID=1396 RepID=UPI001C8CB264|nr:hypothetical protein [Bacillus cereus]MBX9158466.1 hypothetical protein [Bacillus cereus]